MRGRRWSCTLAMMFLMTIALLQLWELQPCAAQSVAHVNEDSADWGSSDLYDEESDELYDDDDDDDEDEEDAEDNDEEEDENEHYGRDEDDEENEDNEDHDDDEEEEDEDDWDWEEDEDEMERREEYDRRGYTWPVKEYVPNTPGWSKLMSDRLHQVSLIPDAEIRFANYAHVLNSAVLLNNFTEFGFGLARAPQKLTESLRKAVRDGLPQAQFEQSVPEMDNVEPNRFINSYPLVQRVLHEMQPYAEAWSGVKLHPYEAYGFRLYQNQSTLAMHIDRVQSHVISFILHVDSSEDAEPWPLVMEDYQGRTHQVVLTPGDMLFYESAKCWHGRPSPFHGSWYTSVFVHYHPIDWTDANHMEEAGLRVPKEWVDDPEEEDSDENDDHPETEWLGSGIRHPDCPGNWCSNKESTAVFAGPGKDGVWIDANRESRPLTIIPAAERQPHEEL